MLLASLMAFPAGQAVPKDAKPGVDYIPNVGAGKLGGAQPGRDYIPNVGAGTGDTPAGAGGKKEQLPPGTISVGDPVVVTLRYTGDAKKEEPEPDAADIAAKREENAREKAAAGDGGMPEGKVRCGGGGLVGAMNCIGERIAGAGARIGAGGGGDAPAGESSLDEAPESLERNEGPADVVPGETPADTKDEKSDEEKEKLTATFQVVMKPRLESAVGGRRYKIVADVGAQKLNIPEGLEDDIKAKLQSEAEGTVEEIKRWFSFLNDEQAKRMRRDGKITGTVRKPFNHLALFSRPHVRVTVPWAVPERDEKIRLRFVMRNDSGLGSVFRIPRGEVFWVEVDYDKRPDEEEKTVTLTWDQTGKAEVTVKRTEENGELFRSGPFYISETTERDLGKDYKGKRNKGEYIAGGWDWFFGEWDVAYRDRKLGPVKGRAVVVPPRGGERMQRPVHVKVTLKHPKDGTEYHLSAAMIEPWPDRITLTLEGNSPPSGGEDGEDPLKGATAINISPKGKIAVSTEKSTETAPIEDGARFKLDLMVADKDRNLSSKVGEKIKGRWSYLGPEARVRFSRAGKRKDREESGGETWTRTPFSLKRAETDRKAPIIYMGRGTKASKGGRKPLAKLWVRFDGANLPVQPGRKVTVKFDDPMVRYLGKFRADSEDPSKLFAHVMVYQGIDGAKRKVKLNGVETIWDPGFFGHPRELRFVRKFRDDQYEETRQIYYGEAVQVQAIFDQEPISSVIEFGIIRQGDAKDAKPVTVTANKDKTLPKSFVSEPILVLEKKDTAPKEGDFDDRGEDPGGRNYPKGIRAILRGAGTITIIAKQQPPRPPKSEQQKVPAAIAQVIPVPPSKWEKAVAEANACYKKFPDRYTVSNRIFTEGFKKRSITVGVKDHAAILLLREGLVKDLDAFIAKQNKKAPIDYSKPKANVRKQLTAWNKFQNDYARKMVEMALAQRVEHPLFYMEVSTPKGRAAFSETMGGGKLIGNRTHPLWDSLSYYHSNDAFPLIEDGKPVIRDGEIAIDEKSYLEYARRVIAEAQGKLHSLADQAARRARGAQTCDIEALLRLVGFGVDKVIARVVPTLMRPAGPNDPRVPRLVPDRIARGHVETVKNLANAIKAQSQYSELDTQALIAALSVGSMGLSNVAVGLANVSMRAAHVLGTLAEAGLMAADAYELIQFGKDLDTTIKAHEDLVYGEGISSVAGRDYADRAEQEFDAAKFGLAMSGVGAGTMIGPKVFKLAKKKGFSPTDTAQQIVAKRALKNGVDDLTDAERKVFDYMHGEALDKLGKKGKFGLSDEERSILGVADGSVAPTGTGKGTAASQVADAAGTAGTKGGSGTKGGGGTQVADATGSGGTKGGTQVADATGSGGTKGGSGSQGSQSGSGTTTGTKGGSETKGSQTGGGTKGGSGDKGADLSGGIKDGPDGPKTSSAGGDTPLPPKGDNTGGGKGGDKGGMLGGLEGNKGGKGGKPVDSTGSGSKGTKSTDSTGSGGKKGSGTQGGKGTKSADSTGSGGKKGSGTQGGKGTKSVDSTGSGGKKGSGTQGGKGTKSVDSTGSGGKKGSGTQGGKGTKSVDSTGSGGKKGSGTQGGKGTKSADSTGSGGKKGSGGKGTKSADSTGSGGSTSTVKTPKDVPKDVAMVTPGDVKPRNVPDPTGGKPKVTDPGSVTPGKKVPPKPDATGPPKLSRQEAKKASNVVDEHAEAISDVARARDEVILTRPVNPDSTPLIADGAATKGMHVKGKSSDWGPQKGFIPVDQKFSKLGNPTKNANPEDVAKFSKKVKDCFAEVPPCAGKIELEVDGKAVVIVKDKVSGKEIPVFKDKAGRYLDPDSGKPLKPADIDTSNARPMEVLSADGKPLTADYDLLAIGGRDPPSGFQNHADMGQITGKQIDTVNDINTAVKKKSGYDGGNVVHHGPENQFGGSPGVDYPITSFQPDGQVVNIPKGPDGDPDRYLKDYFHEMRQKGYQLDPNPKWGWGEYDAAKGWGPKPPPKTPKTKMNFVDANGKTVDIDVGDNLGKGSSSKAAENAANTNEVVRITKDGPNSKASKLDEAGRDVLEKEVDPSVVRAADRSANHHVTKSADPDLVGAKVEVVEKITPARVMVAKQPGGKMTDGQAMAFDQATRELNRKGHAWVDNHSGNYGFERMAGEDRWRVVVLDTGGIVPMKGATPLKRWKNARDLQRRINTPSADVKRALDNNINKKMLADVERKEILQEFGDNIDLKAIDKDFDKPSDVAFNPLGVTPYKKAQDLFAKDPTEAAKGFKDFTKKATARPKASVDAPGAGRSGGTPAANQSARGGPVGGKTGVERQMRCENCGLVALEAVLQDARIVPRARPQDHMRAFAIDRNLLQPGNGMTVHQLSTYLHMSGVDPKHVAIGAHSMEDLARSVRNGRDAVAIIQNGSGGYHWVRVEGFTRDANGTAWVSIGEGGLPQGVSARMTVAEFDRITQTYPDASGASSRMRSMVINTPGLSDAERAAARAAATDNARTGAEAFRTAAARNTGGPSGGRLATGGDPSGAGVRTASLDPAGGSLPKPRATDLIDNLRGPEVGAMMPRNTKPAHLGAVERAVDDLLDSGKLTPGEFQELVAATDKLIWAAKKDPQKYKRLIEKAHDVRRYYYKKIGKEAFDRLEDRKIAALKNNEYFLGGEISSSSHPYVEYPSTTAVHREYVKGEPYRDPLTNQIIDPSKEMAADHIYPAARVKSELRDFEKLEPHLQMEVVHDLNNIQPLPKKLNEQKSNMTAAEWAEYMKGIDQPLDKKYVSRLADMQDHRKKYLQDLVDCIGRGARLEACRSKVQKKHFGDGGAYP